MYVIQKYGTRETQCRFTNYKFMSEVRAVVADANLNINNCVLMHNVE